MADRDTYPVMNFRASLRRNVKDFREVDLSIRSGLPTSRPSAFPRFPNPHHEFPPNINIRTYQIPVGVAEPWPILHASSITDPMDTFKETAPLFPRFMDLPYDLRFMIWSQFLPSSPRIVHIFERALKGDWQKPGLEQDMIRPAITDSHQHYIHDFNLWNETTQWAVDSDACRPTELFACREAYALLADWGPRFTCSTKDYPDTVAQTFFHPRDTLYLSEHTQRREPPDPSDPTQVNPIFALVKMAETDQLRCVKNLALCPYTWSIDLGYRVSLEQFVAKVLHCFGAVEHLTLVNEQTDFDEELINEYAWTCKRRTDLVYIDAIDTRAAFVRYESPDPKHRPNDLARLPPDIDWLWWGDINIEEVDRHRLLLLESQPDKPAWELPTIKWKVIVNRERKEDLDAAEKQYLEIMYSKHWKKDTQALTE